MATTLNLKHEITGEQFSKLVKGQSIEVVKEGMGTLTSGVFDTLRLKISLADIGFAIMLNHIQEAVQESKTEEEHQSGKQS
jgi:hypothetical protein